MKLARFDGGHIGVVHDNAIVDVTRAVGVDPGSFPPVATVQMIANFESIRPMLMAAEGPLIPLEQVRLESPISWPNKIIAMPGNFRDHREEMINAPTALGARGFFLKAPSALSGAGEPIILPDLPKHQIHHEAELAIIIGRKCRSVPRSNAFDVIFGYACALDITVRDMAVDRILRKSYDTFAPLGPWIATAAAVGDPSTLQMKLWVGDELRQDANMRDLLVDIPAMIEMTSAVMTLYPGDIIFGGTPAGVALIQDGDIVTIEIERIGRMSVPVKQGKGGNNAAFDGYEPAFDGTRGQPVSRRR